MKNCRVTVKKDSRTDDGLLSLLLLQFLESKGIDPTLFSQLVDEVGDGSWMVYDAFFLDAGQAPPSRNLDFIKRIITTHD